MKKLLAICVILLFMGMTISSSTGLYVEKQSTIATLDGNTLYVGGSGPNNHTRIQDAIDNASNGDTVYVYDDSSPYYENLIVDKSINLIGEDRNTTVIDGGGIDSTIEVSADNVSIEGFAVTNCVHDLSEAGINIFTDGNTVKNNNIVENQCTGIRLSSSHYNLIDNNFLKDNIGYYIFLRSESNNNTVQNNTLTQSDDLIKVCNGIWLSKSSYNLIENNEITGLKFPVGIALDVASSYNVVKKNMIHNNTYNDEAKSIQICDSDFNLVLNNEIRSNGGSGIMMFFSQGNEIIGNTIDSILFQGISLADCRYNNIIKFNNISSTEKGIDIGMYSSKNIVESNNLTNNTYGIYLLGTDLLGFVPNNVITKNNIVENDYGIYIRVSDYYGYSNDSLIYHNNFINNTQNAYDVCNNSWDNGYPSGGNFWDDYTGNDTDGDGIGDTPYNITGGDNQDLYPFMYPNGWVNNPPYPPSDPIPEDGEHDVPVTVILNWTGGDPDPCDTVTYDVYFGVTNPPTKKSSNQTETFYEPFDLVLCKTYYWFIVAWDNHGVCTKGPIWSFTTFCGNLPPDMPIIDGPSSGKAGETYIYSFDAVDPDGHDIYYFIDWGDGTNTSWLGQYESGEKIYVNHSWSERGTYSIGARAKDVYDAIGEWAYLEVTMPKNKAFTFNFNLLSWLFERFPNAFPILRHVFEI